MKKDDFTTTVFKNADKRRREYIHIIDPKEFIDILDEDCNHQFRCFANGAISENIVMKDILSISNHGIKDVHKGNDCDKVDRNGDVIFTVNGKKILVQVKTPRCTTEDIKINETERSVEFRLDLRHSDGVNEMVLPDVHLKSAKRIKNYLVGSFHILAVPTYYMDGNKKRVIYCLSSDIPKDDASSYLLKRNIRIKCRFLPKGNEIFTTNGIEMWTTNIVECLENIKNGYCENKIREIEKYKNMIDDL